MAPAAACEGPLSLYARRPFFTGEFMNLKIIKDRVITFLPFSETAGVLVGFFPVRKPLHPIPFRHNIMNGREMCLPIIVLKNRQQIGNKSRSCVV